MTRKISGTKTEEATAESRILHNEELHNLYSRPNTIKVIK
jgi:hypothetical protein